jgi:hypothetical protein
MTVGPRAGDDVVDETTGGTAAVAFGSIVARVHSAEGRLRLGVERDGVVIADLLLGATVDGTDLGAASRIVRSSRREIVETENVRSGKATGALAHRHQELALSLEHEGGLPWQLIVRLAADGVAFQYRADGFEGHGRFDGESTELAVDPARRAWVLDYQTWYETPRFGSAVGDLPPGDYGFPLLVETEAGYALLTESGIDGRFSGSHAVVDSGAIRFAPADAAREFTRGPITPWRVLILGDLATIVESRLVDELAPPVRTELQDADWVRPGRAAWSWWSDFYSSAQLQRQQHFVDVAAQLGWEHLLIDCGWEQTWIPEIVAYASARGIQVHLWTVWHDVDGPQKLAQLALWRSWGVAGIKVDFMESESKDRYRWYDAILTETARVGLMVNFHGSVIPRGWARTWPHVVSYEAIRGSEYYVFYNDTPLTAAHNVIQPFTRNVVGAMDYTPVAFDAPGRTTTDAHELALAVAFESGVTHFAADVDAVLARPAAAAFLAELAPRWDETRLLAGSPDDSAVLARRSGDRWFVGAIATGETRTLRAPLDRLGLAGADAWIISDGPDALVDERRSDLDALEVPVLENGGFVAIVAAAGIQLTRAVPRRTAEAVTVAPDLAELDADGTALLTTPHDATLLLAPGWHADALGDGAWRVRSPRELEPGQLGVVTVEVPGDPIPRTAPARLLAPLTPGEHVLSALPMIAFRNEFGPVERDMSNGGGNPRDGLRMAIAGESFDDGFGASTPSSVTLHLGGRAGLLVARIGVDDETPDADAVAIIRGDGRELARAAVTGGQPAVALEVDVTGVRLLELVTESADPPTDPAHVDWAAARIHVPSLDHR